MPIPPLPTAYIERMTSLLGDEATAFFASYEQPARAGLRVNTNKITVEEFRKRSPWKLDPVPWCPTGFYLPEDAQAGKHPWYAAGLYYLQEPSAMAPVEQMDLDIAEWVVDACAAPGGKSTQIHNRLRDTGLLVANEVVGSRVKSLGENLERWGCDRTLITSLEIGRMAALQGSGFDPVLVDAPCSGEGLFRRTPEARTEWSPAHVDGSARRQRNLLDAAGRLVGPGGSLVYSTCTFAPEENEQVIAAFLDTHPAWSLDRLEIPGGSPGRNDWVSTSHDLSGMVRLWPHRVEGDGHTIARLYRDASDEPDEGEGITTSLDRRAIEKAEEIFEHFLDEFAPGFVYYGIPIMQKERLFLLPEYGDLVGELPMVRSGLWLGTAAPGRFTPSHALALFLKSTDWTLVEELDFEEAARYLAGETLTRPGDPGWVLITFDGFPLGWGKRSGDVIKNHYPKGLRRPVGSWQY